jgi:hypothetical protein
VGCSCKSHRFGRDDARLGSQDVGISGHQSMKRLSLYHSFCFSRARLLGLFAKCAFRATLLGWSGRDPLGIAWNRTDLGLRSISAGRKLATSKTPEFAQPRRQTPTIQRGKHKPGSGTVPKPPQKPPPRGVPSCRGSGTVPGFAIKTPPQRGRMRSFFAS